MPDRDVRTLRDLSWYQYAKIIARRALGPEVKREQYGFVGVRDVLLLLAEATRADGSGQPHDVVEGTKWEGRQGRHSPQ